MTNEDENRKAILARRARYIAMALAGVGSATTSACANVCLSIRRDTGNTSADAGVDGAEDATSVDANEHDER